MAACRVPTAGSGSGVPGCDGGTPGKLIVGLKTEIPVVDITIAAAGTQAVAYAPDEGEVEVIGVIFDGIESELIDVSIANFAVRGISYNPQASNSLNTATVVTAGSFNMLQFSREAFYYWSRDGLGCATPFPYGLPHLTTDIAFGFTVTNNHASANRRLQGSIVVVRTQ